tara:strand:- start:2484 stop:3335 length:852 start_codon:yes stop_codon:yes gene_type:complete
MVNGIVFDRVLSVGINYVGTNSQLNGCINDIINLKKVTKAKSYVVMTELSGHKYLRPKRANIIAQIKKFTTGVKPGMNLLFQYSGHGSHTRDANNDEADGRDETICPLDYSKAGMIKDDDLRKLLIDPLPEGCNLWCIMDCCHSGTIMDLANTYQIKNRNIKNNDKDNKDNKKKNKRRYVKEISKTIPLTNCQVICFSGCLDTQFSADAYIGRTYQGAMTWGILESLKYLKRRRKLLTYRNIMRHLLKLLKNSGYDQIPQISSGKPLNLDTEFTPVELKKKQK